MEKELRILILEDVSADAELMEREIRQAGFEFASRRVETKGTFLKELGDFAPDLILADYKLPSFDGLSALAIAQEKCPDIPFLFISGTVGEELAIETLKRGATDYVLKQGLSRLGPAVNRALREVEERNDRKRAEEALRTEREKLEAVTQNMGAGLAIISKDYRTLWANKVLKQIFGKVEVEFAIQPITNGQRFVPGVVSEIFFKREPKKLCTNRREKISKGTQSGPKLLRPQLRIRIKMEISPQPWNSLSL
ncbi:MAG: response regulator [Deltaproteobacteria bacterium]|nr:response regulator [Deltaproteobacteria bacterium]